ncbi:conserved exported hypothetical protein [Rubrivivax sp. A210]|uniref:hypothetical protein n=1 Tax=Rubrivivax sp. A210 TaxID=2772301 RepID=UPI0019185F46|nr:hypothetical protein [Rubrivivax sp. A210]CAD5373691.1 conserved exported hypothetical protein [Rubrivivax sp. A210]
MPRSLASCLMLTLLLGACAVAPPPLGSGRDEVLRARGQPSARYALPGGGERLEYATGPYGRTTWMIDLDAAGRVTGARQVLSEAEFLAVQSAPGLTREALLRWIGRPGERRHGGRPGGEVWSWRYPTNDCLWFQASVTDDGLVSSAAYGIDPRCDGMADHTP